MDRKSRIREYKEGARPMGVFRVLNTDNGKSFVGSSVDLPSMLNRQRFQLELGSHPDRDLQADWNAASPEAFTFEVLDMIEPSDGRGGDTADDLRMLLQMWLDKLGGAGEPLYNRTPGRDG
jgi:hypothetical protein